MPSVAPRNGAQGERTRHLGSRRECSRSGGKGEEERVSLRVDLDTSCRRAGRAHDPSVLGECIVVGLVSDLIQELGRALDVGEEEGDRAGREVAPHSIIMNQRGGELTLRHTRGSNSLPPGPLCRPRRGS